MRKITITYITDSNNHYKTGDYRPFSLLCDEYITANYGKMGFVTRSGIGMTTSSFWNYRLWGLIPYYSDIFVLMFGTNDSYDSSGGIIPIATKKANFKAKYAQVVALLKQKNPHAKFIIVSPIGMDLSKCSYNAPYIADYRLAAQEFAAENGYYCVKGTDAITDEMMTVAYNAAITDVNLKICTDSEGLHCRKHAHELLAPLFYTIIDTIMAEFGIQKIT